MKYTDLKRAFWEANNSAPKERLTAHIIFTAEAFMRPFPLLGRTYSISSDNKAFLPNMAGYSIFGYCLDTSSDQGVRLDWYMEEEGRADGWKVEECYILEQMRDVSAIPSLTRAKQADGSVCYFFGDTTIRVRETRDNGRLYLEPLSGDQTACGEWQDLPIDRVYGYCTLLERHLNPKT